MIRADIFRLSIRQLCGTHRLGLTLFLTFLAILPALLAQTAIEAHRIGTGSPPLEGVFQLMLEIFELPFLYPMIILIFASIALRDEISNGTISYLWVKPIARESIVLSKFLAALTSALIFAAPSMVITTMLMTANWQTALNLLLVVVAALLAYGSLFLLLSLLSGRSILIGFFYLLIWESLLSRVSTLASDLSIRHYVVNLSRNMLGQSADLSTVTCLVVLLAVAVVSLVVAIRRFSSMEFPGEME